MGAHCWEVFFIVFLVKLEKKGSSRKYPVKSAALHVFWRELSNCLVQYTFLEADDNCIFGNTCTKLLLFTRYQSSYYFLLATFSGVSLIYNYLNPNRQVLADTWVLFTNQKVLSPSQVALICTLVMHVLCAGGYLFSLSEE